MLLLLLRAAGGPSFKISVRIRHVIFAARLVVKFRVLSHECSRSKTRTEVQALLSTSRCLSTFLETGLGLGLTVKGFRVAVLRGFRV